MMGRKKSKYYSETVWYVHCEAIDDEGPTIIEVGRFEDGSEVLEFRETTCNGQEDTHAVGTLVRKSANHLWEWEDGPSEFRDDYKFRGYSAAVIKFFNDNPPPEEAYQ